jgi:hypothetical protein
MVPNALRDASEPSVSAPAAPLTILSTPKRFEGIFDVIQTNAVSSWCQLASRPEVILFGDDEGTDRLADRLGVVHMSDVARNERGTPLLSDMWMRGQQLASNPVVCWSNADIIFTDRLLEAAAIVAERPTPVLLVGRRCDLDQPGPLDLADPRWQERLVARAAREGERKPANWIDYFVFTRGLFDELPPFAIGRAGYDPWIIWRAAQLGAEVIDASRFVLAVHQRHDYAHVGGRREAFRGAESVANSTFVTDFRHNHSISHARSVLDADGVVRPARRLEHRMARPKRYVAHGLRFTRPARIRLLGERASWRQP